MARSALVLLLRTLKLYLILALQIFGYRLKSARSQILLVVSNLSCIAAQNDQNHCCFISTIKKKRKKKKKKKKTLFSRGIVKEEYLVIILG